MKKNVVVYGFGGCFRKYEDIIQSEYNIVAIADRDRKKWGNFREIPIIDPHRINDYRYDFLLVVLETYDYGLTAELVELGVRMDSIKPFFRPGYLKWGDYTASIIQLGSNYGIKIDINEGITFVLRTKTDLVVFDEIYLDNDYRVLAQGKITVIDIGMNVGLASLYYAQYENVEMVYGFEAFSSTYEIASDNISRNSDTIRNKIKTYNYALSNYNGEKILEYITDEPGNMDILHNNKNNTSREMICEKVDIKDAAEVLKPIVDYRGNNKILLKCDCEGSEYDIFNSMEKTGIIESISVFVIETHLGRGEEIVSILAKNGFNVFAPVSRDGRLGMIYACR